MRYVILLLAVAFSIGTYASPKILVLNDPTGEPLTTPEKDGFLDILVGRAFQHAEIELSLIRLPAERALLNANAGIEDGDLSRIKGMEHHYPNLMRVPEKIFDMHFVGFTRRHGLKGGLWRHLDSSSVAYIRGWKIFESNTVHVPIAMAVAGKDQLMSLLDKDRVDVVLYAKWLGLALIKNHRLANVHVIDPPFAVKPMYIYLHKKHRSLVPAIAESLRELKVNGFYDQLYRKKLTVLTTISP